MRSMFFFFKQKTAYEIVDCDWSSDVCSSDLVTNEAGDQVRVAITGTDAPPIGEVTATGLAVTLGEVVAGAEDDAIQVVVTGEDDEEIGRASCRERV